MSFKIAVLLASLAIAMLWVVAMLGLLTPVETALTSVAIFVAAYCIISWLARCPCGACSDEG